ncbi:MAG: hypothetical protein QM722_03240 [Piscinibacter sp.]
MRRILAHFATLLVLSACAGSSFAPSPVPASGTPYAGLGESSYGPRSSAQLRLCEAAPSSSSTLSTLSAVASTPAKGLLKVDETLQRLDLASQFTDPLGASHPPVAVLSHAPDAIVFWHSARSVGLAEVSRAAKAYCAGLQRGVLYRGSASRCPTPERGLSGAMVVNTYVISAYACTGRP